MPCYRPPRIDRPRYRQHVEAQPEEEEEDPVVDVEALLLKDDDSDADSDDEKAVEGATKEVAKAKVPDCPMEWLQGLLVPDSHWNAVMKNKPVYALAWSILSMAGGAELRLVSRSWRTVIDDCCSPKNGAMPAQFDRLVVNLEISKTNQLPAPEPVLSIEKAPELIIDYSLAPFFHNTLQPLVEKKLLQVTRLPDDRIRFALRDVDATRIVDVLARLKKLPIKEVVIRWQAKHEDCAFDEIEYSLFNSACHKAADIVERSSYTLMDYARSTSSTDLTMKIVLGWIAKQAEHLLIRVSDASRLARQAACGRFAGIPVDDWTWLAPTLIVGYRLYEITLDSRDGAPFNGQFTKQLQESASEKLYHYSRIAVRIVDDSEGDDEKHRKTKMFVIVSDEGRLSVGYSSD